MDEPLQGQGVESKVDVNDGSLPQWLHPISLLFDVFSSIRNHLVPTAIAIFGAASGSLWGIWFAAVVFGFSMLHAIFRYVSLRYQLRDGDFVVDEGIIFRVHRTVPVSRIQNVDLVQNILHRIFRVAEVRIETAAGAEPEAILRVLSLDDVERLRNQIYSYQAKERTSVGSELKATSKIADANSESLTSENATQSNLASDTPIDSGLASIPILRIKPWLLCKAGFISNRGTVFVAFLIGLMFQFDIEKRFKLSSRFDISGMLAKYTWAQGAWNSPKFIAGVILAFIGFAILLRILSAAWYLIRFYDYHLDQYGSDLRIRCGMFTKVSATVPIHRIQFISIHRNLLSKWLGLASIRIETAGGGAKESEDAATTVSRQWFVPVLDEAEVPRLVSILRPGIRWDETAMDWKPLSPLAKKRKRRMSLFLAVLIAIASYWFIGFWSLLAGGMVAVVGWWWAAKKARSMRYAREDWGIVYRSGLFTKKCSVTFADRIQSVKLLHSPFDRKWKMATLELDTAAAGPAEHRIEIPMLDATFAEAEYRAIAQQVALNSD